MGILRLLLALAVVASHCGAIFGNNLVGGKVAVQSFYIISGFYMSLILNEKYIDKNTSYKLFISNRLLRLYPIYWAVLILTFLFWCFAEFKSHGQSQTIFDVYASVHLNAYSIAYLIFTNIFIFGQDVVMFLGINPANGNLFFTNNFWHTTPGFYTFLFVTQAWTLGVELTFYLIAPLILRKNVIIIVCLISISLFVRFYLFYYVGFKTDPWSYRFFPSEIMFFLLGYLSYLGYKKNKITILNSSIAYFLLAFIIMFTICFSNVPSGFESVFSMKEAFYFACITCFIPFLFNFFKHSNVDRLIGELSYPVYISHKLVFAFCLSLHFSIFKQGFVIALITICVSYFLNRLIANPIEKYRQLRLTK